MMKNFYFYFAFLVSLVQANERFIAVSCHRWERGQLQPVNPFLYQKRLHFELLEFSNTYRLRSFAMSSLNKIVINGGKALDSRRSLASRAGSRRNTPAVSSARNSQRSRRNMEMLVKRVETRSRIIKKAFGEIKKVHPNEMSYESLKNCVVRYKLPLSKDAVRMLWTRAVGKQPNGGVAAEGVHVGPGENDSLRTGREF